MNLFTISNFASNAGIELGHKIECDALNDESLKALANWIGPNINFQDVVGVPRGGVKFASELKKYADETGPILIVDDVLTTGGSMERMRAQIAGDQECIGLVIFARGPCPDWVTPFAQLDPMFW